MKYLGGAGVALLVLGLSARGADVSYSIGGAGAVIFDNSGLFPSGTSTTGAIAYATTATGQTGPSGKTYPASAASPLYVSLKLGSTTVTYLDNAIGNMFVGNLTAAPGNEMQMMVFGGPSNQNSLRVLFESTDGTLFPTTDMPASIDFSRVGSITWEYIHTESSNQRTTQGDVDQFHTAVAAVPAGVPEPSSLMVIALAGSVVCVRRSKRG